MEPPEATRDYEPIHPGTNWRGVLRRIFGPVIVALGAAAKYGFAFAKFASIFVAVGGYALLWGWQFGVGITGLILIHELGHYVVARALGLHPHWPIFIPFMGAFVAFKSEKLTPWALARVALAGPFIGAAGAAVFWGIGEARHSQVLQALGYFGFLLNLFNLIPIGFLDGGQILRAFQYLRRGGAEGRAIVIGSAYGALALFLVLGMVASHVSQHRL
ncbi:MAG TPA: site-2 protease family protein [Gaiellaceae bacterium]|nr:site-2 protease family protein [Gaiellaceae bacterium]